MTNQALRAACSRLASVLLAAICAISLNGCAVIHSAHMGFPNAFGLDEAAADLYVEPAMSADQRQELRKQIGMGRAVVAHFYGDIKTAPYFVACLTAECDDRFGSCGQRAAAYADFAIRLSAKGMSAPLVAHEWSHAELYRRAGGWWQVRKIPRWFDEGVAVVVADEQRHSEDNWREIQRRGLPVPPLGSLISFSDWGDAVKKYGETAGDVPDNLHVVYTLAGHQVRTFLSCAGPTGVADVLDAVRSGSTFDHAYAAVRAKCVR